MENKVNLRWVAVFNDGTILKRYNNDRDDNFKIVRERFDELKSFYLEDDKSNMIYQVDLDLGQIFVGKVQEQIFEFNKDKNNIRLIYKQERRLDATFGGGNINITPIKIWHILGCQWNDIQGNNHKLIFQIEDTTGLFVAGD